MVHLLLQRFAALTGLQEYSRVFIPDTWILWPIMIHGTQHETLAHISCLSCLPLLHLRQLDIAVPKAFLGLLQRMLLFWADAGHLVSNHFCDLHKLCRMRVLVCTACTPLSWSFFLILAPSGAAEETGHEGEAAWFASKRTGSGSQWQTLGAKRRSVPPQEPQPHL